MVLVEHAERAVRLLGRGARAAGRMVAKKLLLADETGKQDKY